MLQGRHRTRIRPQSASAKSTAPPKRLAYFRHSLIAPGVMCVVAAWRWVVSIQRRSQRVRRGWRPYQAEAFGGDLAAGQDMHELALCQIRRYVALGQQGDPIRGVRGAGYSIDDKASASASH